MAEMMKVTTPMVPKENTGAKFKPTTDQAAELRDLNKINKAQQESKVADRKDQALRDYLGRAAVQPLLRETADLSKAIQKMVMLTQMGLSSADIIKDPLVKELLKELFLSPAQLMQALEEQNSSAVLFRGEAFDALRSILAKFPGDSQIRAAAAYLLKIFDQHVNAQNSIKTILYNCRNMLDYMFSKDRQQFQAYLDGLRETLLPPAVGFSAEETARLLAQLQEELGMTAEEARQAVARHEAMANQPGVLPMEQREAAQILKGNLLPLLGEIVVKYNQNEHIRDIVMVVVHNIVRLDQGTPENLEEALAKLAHELRQVANLPENFEKNLMKTLHQSVQQARGAQDAIVDKLASLISATLRDQTANPAVLRQAENLLMSLLQNQSSLMNVLHFMLPMQTPDGNVLAELYVDPDSQEKSGRGDGKGNSRKLFLTFESEHHGSFELSFVETGERVDLAMWCPETLVRSMAGLRRQFGTIMQSHGFTMNNFQVSELKKPQNILQVFPGLLDRKVGIDVRI